MGDTIVNNSPQAQGNVGVFVARTAAGVSVGTFPSASEAQKAIEGTSGNLLTWTQQDLPGGIEFYVGTDNT